MALEAYDSDLVPPAFGLNNTGVICHFNSLLQGLVGCSAVVRATFANRDYLGRSVTGRSFYDFVHAAVPAARPRVANCVPFTAALALQLRSAHVLRALQTDLRRRRPDFRYGPNQESASEGLVLLLEMMDDPNPAPIVTGEAITFEENPIARLFYHRYEAEVYCRKCKARVSKKDDVAVQFNLFHFDTLVAGTRPADPDAFGEMLRSHISNLEDYTCEWCKTKSGGIRHYRLCMVPEILVCLFNLYDDRVARRPRYFSSWVSFPGIGGAKLKYIQVAQVEQCGSLSGGHYMARCLRADGAVYCLNDSGVSTGAFGPGSNVYMVFYHYASSAGPGAQASEK